VRAPGQPLPDLGRLTIEADETPQKKGDGMIETIVALAILCAVGYYSYLSGKQIGSHKGIGAGRYRRK
jgi:hypothetical protein